MSERLYYINPYRTQFSARVVERLTWDDHPAVILDRTAFYPTSGGQPADRGTLNGLDVLDVVERAEDGAVIHLLSENLTASQVEGVVDWPRRLDHMQQHTGQHILSAAFKRALDAETIGFHLSAESSTIDLDTAGLEMEAVLPAEDLANQVIWENRPVSVRFVDAEELAGLPVERPPDVSGPVRLVTIEPSTDDATPSFDVNPCGGTHVTHTGEIGMIKIVDLEHRGDATRVEFLCGKRALRDYRTKNAITSQLASRLTVGYWELDEAIERLEDEIKQLRRDQRQMRQQLLDVETEDLIESASARGSYRLVSHIWEQRPPDELRTLARKLAEHDGVIALLFSINERTHLCFARAEELSLDAAALLRGACEALDGKGGGRPAVAQGSASVTDRSRIEAVLADLISSLPA
jgi:alanyl-tRNA synthetase